MIEPLLGDDAFLADVESAPRSADLLHLWWLGQSGFLLNRNRKHLLFDPYLSDSLTRKYADSDKPHVRMSRRVVDPARLDFIDVVTASHTHTDHLDAETLLPIWRINPGMILVEASANFDFTSERLGPVAHGAAVMTFHHGRNERVDDFNFTGIAAAHEAREQDERGHDRYLGFVVECGPFTVYHSGDTVLYEGLVESLSRFAIDVALLPINGRGPERRVAGNLWGREAAWLAKEIGAKLVVPCHYDMFEFNTATPDEFVAECERLGQPYKVLRLGERLTISESGNEEVLPQMNTDGHR